MEGGGVISEDERGGGEINFLSDWEDRSLMIGALRSGDGERRARFSGVAGARISAGAARGD